jgi:hypothetical protein
LTEYAAFGAVAVLGVGITLGLLGSGGSVLTVPVLVYVLGLPMHDATGHSLALVGVTGLAGAWAHWRRGNVSPQITGWFGIPSLLSVYATRTLLAPRLPAAADRALLLAFAGLMTAAAAAMLRRRVEDPKATAAECSCPALTTQGLLIGVVAGLLGAGGGFLIVPALVILGGLPMRLAVGTSLTIIAAQSLAGFAGAYQAGVPFQWKLLAALTSMASLGMALGLALNSRVPAARLRTAFGWFLLLAGAAIAGAELP